MTDNGNRMFVFVYGTLKRNEPNNHWLNEADKGVASFYSRGQMSTKYPLVIASRYNIPFLLDQPGIGQNIQGEVWEIDERMLAHLDILEEHPKLYTRRLEEIALLDRVEEKVQAWTYFLVGSRPDLLQLPHLTSYSSSGPHNLPYITSDDLSDPEDIN